MAARAQRWIGRGRLGEVEAGLTMIEVLVATVILVLGAAATFGLLGAATRNAQRAKASQVALDLAQEEMERLHSIPYNELAVSALPAHESGAQKPNSRISGSLFAVHRTPASNYFPLDVEPEKGVSPESDFFTGDTEGGGGVRGKIYRYVVWRNDPSCNTEECEKSEQDYKQIVVAVKPDTPVQQNAETGYVEVQSAISPPPKNWTDQLPEPGEPSENEPEPDLGAGLTAQQFYLSDTACAASGATKRIEPTADHLLHNTRGTCVNGLKTGTTPGAPDGLLTSPPPDPAPNDETLPLLHDYSDDFYLEPTPDTDKGVQIRRDDTSGCHFEPTGTTNPESQVHRWVTDQMSHTFEMSGRVVLEFYTRTLNDALYTGTLCVYLYEAGKTGAPSRWLTDKSTGNSYWTYTPEGNGYWPRNSWTKVRLTMEFNEAPWPIAKENRLGLALSVDRANTPADAIPILYDHPNYASRLEVDTKTPIEGG
jgi:type II secretory pathway pseudopilin PulG